MEFKEFVKNVLVDIVGAIESAKKEGGGDAICPEFNGATNTKIDVSFDHVMRRYYQIIDFDVAVTTENTSDKKGSGSIKVLGLGAGIGTDTATKNSIVSRIKFQVPIGLEVSKK